MMNECTHEGKVVTGYCNYISKNKKQINIDVYECKECGEIIEEMLETEINFNNGEVR